MTSLQEDRRSAADPRASSGTPLEEMLTFRVYLQVLAERQARHGGKGHATALVRALRADPDFPEINCAGELHDYLRARQAGREAIAAVSPLWAQFRDYRKRLLGLA
jgi:hypothetical protein